VYSGEAALEKAAAFDPQLVFCDIGLPGISGYDVGRAFRADPSFANVVLVALTGWGGEDDKRQSRGAGFDHHLVKPVEIAALHDVLARFL
jgi:two-component system, sensor histidine kinase